MNRIMKSISSLGIFLVLSTGGRAAAAADLSDSGWRVKLNGLAAESTGGGGFNSSLGFGLGLEYRATPNLGVEFGVMNSDIDSEIGFDFFGGGSFSVVSSLRMTPVLAQLNWHLTPGHKVDLSLGPVVGWARYGDLNVRVHVPDGGSVLVDHVQTRDGFVWGGHLGMDVPIGERGLFFTLGATYLKAKVKVDSSGQGETGDGSAADFDLDPFIAQVGFGVRF